MLLSRAGSHESGGERQGTANLIYLDRTKSWEEKKQESSHCNTLSSFLVLPRFGCLFLGLWDLEPMDMSMDEHDPNRCKADSKNVDFSHSKIGLIVNQYYAPNLEIYVGKIVRLIAFRSGEAVISIPRLLFLQYYLLLAYFTFERRAPVVEFQISA